MGRPRIGSLCSGYEGLGMAVQEVLGGDLAWVSDIDKGANKILAHRYPDVPNLGDFTRTDWATVKPISILTAGFPCQPVSHAGQRLGDLDERWLWDDVARAIRVLRPGLVVLENVRGLLTAGAGRLFGRVLWTLANLGYDTQWHGLRAADVGAPHGRWRVFIVAHAQRGGRDGWTPEPLRRPIRGATAAGSGEVSLLPTPVTGDAARSSHSYDRGNPTLIGALLPTPAVNDMGEGKTPEAWDEWTAKMQAAHGNGNGHGKSLSIEAQRLLPTPSARLGDGTSRGASHPDRRKELCSKRGGELDEVAVHYSPDPERWAIYADAIARWEQVLGRPAPAPTQPSKKGTPQLSPRFSEWLMGLPDGWVTDVPGITRNEALKALGNGVVPQQAAAALRFLLGGGEMPAVTPPPPTLLATPRSQHGEERNSNIWARPLDQPQNLENQLARLPGTDGAA